MGLDIEFFRAKKAKRVIEESDRIDYIRHDQTSHLRHKSDNILNFFDPNGYYLEDCEFFTRIKKDEVEEFLKKDMPDYDREIFQKILEETDWENEKVLLSAS